MQKLNETSSYSTVFQACAALTLLTHQPPHPLFLLFHTLPPCYNNIMLCFDVLPINLSPFLSCSFRLLFSLACVCSLRLNSRLSAFFSAFSSENFQIPSKAWAIRLCSIYWSPLPPPIFYFLQNDSLHSFQSNYKHPDPSKSSMSPAEEYCSGLPVGLLAFGFSLSQ